MYQSIGHNCFQFNVLPKKRYKKLNFKWLRVNMQNKKEPKMKKLLSYIN